MPTSTPHLRGLPLPRYARGAMIGSIGGASLILGLTLVLKLAPRAFVPLQTAELVLLIGLVALPIAAIWAALAERAQRVPEAVAPNPHSAIEPRSHTGPFPDPLIAAVYASAPVAPRHIHPASTHRPHGMPATDRPVAPVSPAHAG